MGCRPIDSATQIWGNNVYCVSSFVYETQNKFKFNMGRELVEIGIMAPILLYSP